MEATAAAELSPTIPPKFAAHTPKPSAKAMARLSASEPTKPPMRSSIQALTSASSEEMTVFSSMTSAAYSSAAMRAGWSVRCLHALGRDGPAASSAP